MVFIGIIFRLKSEKRYPNFASNRAILDGIEISFNRQNEIVIELISISSISDWSENTIFSQQ